MSEMRIMTEAGDLKIEWDPNKKEEVSAAEKMYLEYTGKGWKAYEIRHDGKRGKIMPAFDKEAEEVILMPPIMGG